MLKLKSIRGLKDTFSKQASDVARQLSFSGLALVWLLKSGKDSGLDGVPMGVRPAITWFCVALSADFLQYAWQATGWWVLSLKGKPSSGSWVKRPGYIAFFIKLVGVFLGYWTLLWYVFKS